MKSSIMMAAAAFAVRSSNALQSPFRIRSPQHLSLNYIPYPQCTDRLPSNVYPAVKDKPSVEEKDPVTSSLNGDNLSPFLRELVDEQRELQMNVGKAMDVLKSDYPYFLKRSPDFSIYSKDVVLTSSNTPLTTSLSSYQRTISLSRSMLNLLYDPDKSTIQNRMVYDSTRCQIRISFNAQLVPKNVLARRVYIDGISVYSLDMAPIVKDGVRREDGGKIIEHKIEKMLVNGVGMRPPYLGVFGLEGAQGGVLAGAGAWS